MTSRFTCFNTFAAAKAIADANAVDDAEWTYVVEENTFGFFVAIYEDGERIGTL